MRQLWMTLQERYLVILLRWWVVLFTLAGLVFTIFPSDLILWLNRIGHTIFNWPHKALPLPTEHFWQVLAVSLLAVLISTAVIALKNIRQNLGYVRIIIISKLVTTMGFLAAFISSGPYFVYLAGMSIDAIILILTFLCYRRAVISRGL